MSAETFSFTVDRDGMETLATDAGGIDRVQPVPFGDQLATCVGADEHITAALQFTSGQGLVMLALRLEESGLFTVMNATGARHLAANLLRAAETLDGGSGKQ